MNGRTLQGLVLGLSVAAASACGGSEPEPAATMHRQRHPHDRRQARSILVGTAGVFHRAK